MSKELLGSPAPGSEPVEDDVEQNGEKMINEAETISEAAPAQDLVAFDRLCTTEQNSSDQLQEDLGDEKDDAKCSSGDPPVDWFEPLEEDEDADSVGRNDPEEESLAGESERSESMVGSEKAFKKIYELHIPRRKRTHPDEGWLDWPIIGDGWKRKEVVRRSGSSIGQKDVYYLSPRGDRVRSRVELVSVLEGVLDLTSFDYKTGKFYDGEAPPIRVRNRVKRKIRERSSSESSWMERGEGADTPDSHHRLTPIQGTKNFHHNQTSSSSHSTMGSSNQGSRSAELPVEDKIKLPLPSSSSRPLPLPSINGEIGSEDSTLVCAKCGISFTGTWYDKQRKRPCCPTCWASKTKEHPMIRFRKWIPCGQCVGCHNTVNCGQCANCKHGLQSPESRKRICRKRKCICPIRKGPGGGGFLQQRPYNDIPETFDDSMSFQGEVTDSQHPSLKSSDTENFSVNVDVDDEDDLSTDDDDDWHKKRKRRSCGECKACLCRKDCGTCDFCIDKPKFGGSNKKRQKCRLRQCQRQAMRHLLPFQMGQGDYGPDGTVLPGRPRPHYTYSRKSNFKKNKGASGLDFTDNEDDDINFKAQFGHLDFGQRNGLSDRDAHIGNNSEPDQLSRWDAEKSHSGRDGQRHADADEDEDEDEEDFPMITQIFSLADSPSATSGDMENQLMKLLHSLRSSVLPILWYAIMVEGPQLQLIQCSKQSNMTDTMVLIDPGFCYQVTVQKQPLLPTHPLYDKYPGRLSSVTEVVSLLLGLEKYVVCQGLPPKQHLLNKNPLILERASTCDFLVKRKVSICPNCRELQEV
uniref:methyl-CpG-binding domain protein 1b isoform X3 n=1 Tax=Scatophagus argus TaxID=75038 RepID=UPI001ED81A20|nr:methyl-CpG-binding domain protein 1b isoform X3 [Scatophagus argus]